MSARVSTRAEQPALDDERRVGPGEVAQRLRRDHRVAAHERDRDRALEQRHELREPGGLGAAAGQRVLEDLVLGVGRPQRGAQLGELADASGRGTR